MLGQGYLQQPTIYKNTLCFCSDDDIWVVEETHPIARRLTNGPGKNSKPFFSPNGKSIAFIGEKDSSSDIYLIDSLGGEEKRISFFNKATLCGWFDDKHVLIHSHHQNFSHHMQEVYKIHIETLQYEKLPIGHAKSFSSSPDGQFTVIGRNSGDPARWKRYRGGMAGQIWLKESNGVYNQILLDLKSNLSNPIWIGSHIYFISDHEGIGNIYRYNPKNKNLERVTDHIDYYVRSFQTDNSRVCYQLAGECYSIDLETFQISKWEIDFRSPGNQKRARFVDCEENLQFMTCSEQADEVCLISRGKLFILPPFNGASKQLGEFHARYKHAKYVCDNENEYLLAVKINENIFERIVLFDENNIERELTTDDLGKVVEIKCSNEYGRFAFSTGRNQLFWFDINKSKYELIDEALDTHFFNFDWSPCGNFIAYSKKNEHQLSQIYLYDLKKKNSRPLLKSVLSDDDPQFSKCGNYLFFTGIRTFEPIIDEVHHNWSYPLARTLFFVLLNENSPHLLEKNLEMANDDDESEDDDENLGKMTKEKVKANSKNNAKKVKAPLDVPLTQIDQDNIDHRIFSLPFRKAGIDKYLVSENRIFFTCAKDPLVNIYSPKYELDLFCFDLKTLDLKQFSSEVHEFDLSADGKYIIYYCSEGLRLVSSENKPGEGQDFNKKDGWVNLERIQYKVFPSFEWKQMYDEAWLLQKENFWNEEMNSIEWEDVYFRYLPLLEKISTRSEFSDLMWEMQGELGTSHCYESQGDYHRRSEKYPNGHLAAKLEFNKKNKSYKVLKINEGDSWLPGLDSPLLAPSAQLKVGDIIYSINDVHFEQENDLNELLEGQANIKIELGIKRKGAKSTEYVEVVPNESDQNIKYREWVNINRTYVHERTQGKIGYIHLPNMSVEGHKEFFRTYFAEKNKEGLIVDVRYNGGGNLSEQFLRLLAQPTVGFDKTRWFGTWNYPQSSINGPIVAITNEHAGSDGDIFCHAFKLMKIGKLVGTRTWGGVVGIWPRYGLNDGTSTTQPEFSHWFKDVGWNVENFGTDPDIEVKVTPEDYNQNLDPQLERAIKEVMQAHKTQPPLKSPKLRNIPKLSLPKRLSP